MSLTRTGLRLIALTTHGEALMFHSLAFRRGLIGGRGSETGGDAVRSRMSGILGSCCDLWVRVKRSVEDYARIRTGFLINARGSLQMLCMSDSCLAYIPMHGLVYAAAYHLCTNMRGKKSLARGGWCQGPAGRILPICRWRKTRPSAETRGSRRRPRRGRELLQSPLSDRAVTLTSATTFHAGPTGKPRASFRTGRLLGKTRSSPTNRGVRIRRFRR